MAEHPHCVEGAATRLRRKGCLNTVPFERAAADAALGVYLHVLALGLSSRLGNGSPSAAASPD